MINIKFKRALFACALVAGLAGISATSAQAVVVNAFTNSSTGGTGSSTGVILALGQNFTGTVDPNDLCNAGDWPRWSNADWVTGPRFAVLGDASGQAPATLIVADFGLWNQ